MLKETIQTGLRMKVIKPTHLRKVNVDTTVQTKAVRFPTNARLYNRARERLVKAARKFGIQIKQSYERVGPRLLLQQSRYAHARQMKRARACTRKLRTHLGRVIREPASKPRRWECSNGNLSPRFFQSHLCSVRNCLFQDRPPNIV